ncbi:hypothetical protein FHR81_004094 [Actinoalloteichus hoggarensis]|uniref:Uncharacterized protein n=1 Tax=Actinoalloteichus hoggarensis TaxID=1470176 RepID=A0A221WAM5_9PSEU|nr:hypothetical protein AHOG_24720 [Actinoalloteichus hoggarensis]MBB5923027.1 hypothetical protein [Actinoalloteichus hoggarensis]
MPQGSARLTRRPCSAGFDLVDVDRVDVGGPDAECVHLGRRVGSGLAHTG